MSSNICWSYHVTCDGICLTHWVTCDLSKTLSYRASFWITNCYFMDFWVFLLKAFLHKESCTTCFTVDFWWFSTHMNHMFPHICILWKRVTHIKSTYVHVSHVYQRCKMTCIWHKCYSKASASYMVPHMLHVWLQISLTNMWSHMSGMFVRHVVWHICGLTWLTCLTNMSDT